MQEPVGEHETLHGFELPRTTPTRVIANPRAAPANEPELEVIESALLIERFA